jgi:hypothetical protein
MSHIVFKNKETFEKEEKEKKKKEKRKKDINGLILRVSVVN